MEARRPLLLALWLGGALSALAGGESVERLRLEAARRYMEDGPTLRWAAAVREEGRELVAFAIVEDARLHRRSELPAPGRFVSDGAEAFDRAFHREFHGEPVDASPAEEAELRTRLRADPGDAEARDRLARLLTWRKDWKAAIRVLEEGTRIEPADPRWWVNLGSCHDERGREDLARESWARYLHENPDTAAARLERVRAATGSDPDAAAQLLRESLAEFPQSPEFPLMRGVQLIEQGRAAQAEPYVRAAAALGTDSADVQHAVARYWQLERSEPERALPFALAAYFIDPHHWDGEHVERRVKVLAGELAEARLASASREDLLRALDDPDSWVAQEALERLAADWTPNLAEKVAELMGHDDPFLRANAGRILGEHFGPAQDELLSRLLTDEDPYRRGLAAYVAVRQRGAASFDAIRELLRSDVELLRYDAISALAMEGGPAGRRLLAAHRKREGQALLRGRLDLMLGGGGR